MIVEDLKKAVRALDLAVAIGRQKQSPRTGFVHLFPTDEAASDTIPVFENFCFALALFRQKTTESVLEGKELIERLLAFQTKEGNFPIYLHDYPRCWDAHLPLKIAPIFIHLLRDFSAVLAEPFKEKLKASLDAALSFAEKRRLLSPPWSPLWEARLSACKGVLVSRPDVSSAQDWFEWLVSAQLVDKTGDQPIPFDAHLQAFLGEGVLQEKGEPKPLPIEVALAERSGIGVRLLKPHPNQLYCALLYPVVSSIESARPFVCLPGKGGGLRVLWKGESLHSLSIPTGQWDGNRILFELPEEVEMGRDDLFEISLFCDVSAETSSAIGGRKGTIFQFHETISVQTPQMEIAIRFELLKGEGDFCGHISHGNRPEQSANRGENLYRAYDWKIGLRTLRRQGACTIAAAIEFKTRQ